MNASKMLHDYTENLVHMNPGQNLSAKVNDCQVKQLERF